MSVFGYAGAGRSYQTPRAAHSGSGHDPVAAAARGAAGTRIIGFRSPNPNLQ
jgi:hypothetical protein